MKRSNRSSLWRLTVDREVREELEHHLEMRAREYRDQGLSEAEARRRALERFGDPERHARECRRQARSRNRRWRLHQLVEELGQDVGFAARQLRRRPAATLLVVAMLAFGL
ncbi:MAG: permease prefix domain 1-containing protein, partial [Holophagales bacterium]|nr:permease prefix domain 1-containing protein [Holophagales bacterium]